MADRFIKTLTVAYDKEDLWWAIEWWRSTVGDRFKAAGGEGWTTKITGFWNEGGYADRSEADELRRFAKTEHLTPSQLRCQIRNARSGEHALEATVVARFWSRGEIHVEIGGEVKQLVYGLHAELELEKDAEERRLAKEREEAEADARRQEEAAAAAATAAPALQPTSKSHALRNWIVGGVSTVALGLVVAFFTHLFGWNS